MRANLDGANKETMVYLGISNRTFTDVAIDEENGYIYCSATYAYSIYRAPLDIKRGETSSTRTDVEILFTGLTFPSGLQFEDGTLYWVERILVGGEGTPNNPLRTENWLKSWEAPYGSDAIASPPVAKTVVHHNATDLNEFIDLAVDPKRRLFFILGFKGSLGDGTLEQYHVQALDLTRICGFDFL